MALIIRRESKYTVVEMAERRIKNIFSNGLPVYMSFSGGKDSLALATLVYNLIQRGEINPEQLTVNFIDEEAIYPCIEQTVKEWRKKFLLVGAKFNWYCVEVIHFNALNSLTMDETFICWDREKKDVWVRPMPSFAITEHPLLRAREETYQSFLERIESDGITITGVRAAESLQRLTYLSYAKRKDRLHPIYDWKDGDVWLYLYENNVKIPDVYLYMYQTGKSRADLRVSQFFSSDTVGALVRMNEYYPDLMERITRREPNAYLVALYWDSEMFRRSTRKRKELEKHVEQKDYKSEVMRLLSNIPENFPTKRQQVVAKYYKRLMLKIDGIATEKHYKKIYEALIGGDPKLRTYRAIYQQVFRDYYEELSKNERG